MKRFLSISIGSPAFFLIGFFILTSTIIDVYYYMFNLAPGPNGESESLKFFVFIVCPTYLILGGFAGNYLYNKLNNKE